MRKGAIVHDFHRWACTIAVELVVVSLRRGVDWCGIGLVSGVQRRNDVRRYRHPTELVNGGSLYAEGEGAPRAVFPRGSADLRGHKRSWHSNVSPQADGAPQRAPRWSCKPGYQSRFSDRLLTRALIIANVITITL